jgi:hypothetical protein
MLTSEMFCRVAVVRTDVSEKSISSIIKVEGIRELETTLAVTSILKRAAMKHC